MTEEAKAERARAVRIVLQRWSIRLALAEQAFFAGRLDEAKYMGDLAQAWRECASEIAGEAV